MGLMTSLEQLMLLNKDSQPVFGNAPQSAVDTRTFQQYDRNNATARRQIGSAPIGLLMPNNPYRQEAEKRVLENVLDGINGMAMGYTRNGIPHNNQKVVQSYLDNIIDKFKNTGITPKIESVSELDDALTRAKLIFNRDIDGKEIGKLYRHFQPEGVYTSLIESSLPQTVYGQPIQERMGVIPHLYPAEKDFMEKYGGNIYGDFINDITSKAFKREHPGATIETTLSPEGKWIMDTIEKKYPGMMDFIDAP